MNDLDFLPEFTRDEITWYRSEANRLNLLLDAEARALMAGYEKLRWTGWKFFNPHFELCPYFGGVAQFIDYKDHILGDYGSPIRYVNLPGMQTGTTTEAGYFEVSTERLHLRDPEFLDKALLLMRTGMAKLLELRSQR